MKPKTTNPLSNSRWAVEKNFGGINITIIRNGENVKLISKEYKHQKRKTELTKDLLELTESDFIVNAKLEDKKIHIYDVEYLSESTLELPWCERKKLLNKLKYTDNVRDTYAIVVDNQDSLVKAVSAFNKLPNSHGVVVKEYMSKHPKTGHSEWYVLDPDKKTNEG